MKSVPNYTNYLIDEYGNVFNKNTGNQLKSFFKKEKPYLYINLRKDKKLKQFPIHQLVAICYLEHTPCGMKKVIDHIDNNKTNNHYTNLKIVSSRENSSQEHIKSSSKYVGVSWHKGIKKWTSRIRVKGKNLNLGSFKNELSQLEEGEL